MQECFKSLNRPNNESKNYNNGVFQPKWFRCINAETTLYPSNSNVNECLGTKTPKL